MVGYGAYAESYGSTQTETGWGAPVGGTVGASVNPPVTAVRCLA